MPKKIDYVILPTPGANQEEEGTPEEEAARPRAGLAAHKRWRWPQAGWSRYGPNSGHEL